MSAIRADARITDRTMPHHCSGSSRPQCLAVVLGLLFAFFLAACSGSDGLHYTGPRSEVPDATVGEPFSLTLTATNAGSPGVSPSGALGGMMRRRLRLLARMLIQFGFPGSLWAAHRSSEGAFCTSCSNLFFRFPSFLNE